MNTLSSINKYLIQKPENIRFDNGFELCFDPFDNEYFMLINPNGFRQILTYKQESAIEIVKIMNDWQLVEM